MKYPYPRRDYSKRSFGDSPPASGPSLAEQHISDVQLMLVQHPVNRLNN